MFVHNWNVALTVGLASMTLPFGLGYAIAWGLFHEFHDDPGTVPISFGVYGLFVGTALAITAFPVLCRILTELKLLSTSVGVIVLAAGVGNDVTGWVLLALCVSLVNASSGLAALWALLACIGWCLFLVFGVRPCFMWVLRRSGSFQNGPTQGMVCLTVLIVLASAWFTGNGPPSHPPSGFFSLNPARVSPANLSLTRHYRNPSHLRGLPGWDNLPPRWMLQHQTCREDRGYIVRLVFAPLLCPLRAEH